MTEHKNHRRAPENGDLVVIDYPTMNAICVVDGISEDPHKTNDKGHPGNPVYKFLYVCGVGLNGSKPYPLPNESTDSIWLPDDQEHMSIVGVNGYALPRHFYDIDLVDLFRKHGFTIEYS